MKSPVVSRESYEDMKAQRDDWRTRHDALTEKYHALRMEGANIPYPKAERADAPDVVTQAILARSFGNKILRKQYSELVNLRRAEGAPEDAIAAEILKGQSDFDDAVTAIGSVPVE